MTKAIFTEPIPDRRRTRFARNGGRRLTDAERQRARRGLQAARAALAATEVGDPHADIVQPLPPEHLRAARDGIAAARERLSA